MNKKVVNEQWSFGKWQTWCASRIIDLQRGIHILTEALEFIDKDLRGEALEARMNKIAQLRLIESLQRRTGGNDTIDIINRQMKAKALKDIKDAGL